MNYKRLLQAFLITLALVFIGGVWIFVTYTILHSYGILPVIALTIVALTGSFYCVDSIGEEKEIV